jgi:isopropylmalate/homocitrate/citramalate synthase
MNDRASYYLDKINMLDPVLAEFELPKAVQLNDVTLREANQVISMTVAEKIAIAHALDDLGVHQIQVGIPGVSSIDRETMSHLVRDHLKARLEVVSFAYLRDWKKDLTACIESGAGSVDLFYPVSDDKLKAKGVSREQMTRTCVAALEYARSAGHIDITFCPFPAVRTEFHALKDIIAMAVEAGAGRILITDTYGTASPAAMRYFVKELKGVCTVPLGIHCHNDMGLALANSLAAVEGGADMVDASVNGVGDRTGNCSLDEAVIALKAFYDYNLGIRTEGLYDLSRLVAKTTGVALAFGKCLVGDNAFVHRHDDDVKSSRELPSSTVPIEPSLVGNRRRVLLSGEYAGPIVVTAKAEELGLHLGEEQAADVLTEVRKRLEGRKTPLTDEEFLSIAALLT